MILSSLKHLLITQLGVVNKILKDLIHKIGSGKAHRFFIYFLSQRMKYFVFALIVCLDFMYNYILIFLVEIQ